MRWMKWMDWRQKMMDERGNVFQYNCDKCKFGCMSQQIMDAHKKGHELPNVKST